METAETDEYEEQVWGGMPNDTRKRWENSWTQGISKQNKEAEEKYKYKQIMMSWNHTSGSQTF